jgi:hypothetical protein
MHKVDPKFVKRRTAAEVAYDVLVWSLNKGEDILEDDWERTSTRAKSGDYVCLNSPRSVGLTLRDISSFLEASSLGVCPAL